MKQFMLDVETTGLDFKNDEILQIAIIEMLPLSNGTFDSGQVFQTYIRPTKELSNEWARETHKELFAHCKVEGTFNSPFIVREFILDYFAKCGVTAKERPTLCGLNVATFDIPFLMEKGFLKRNDFFYRVDEMTGAINLSMRLLGWSDRNKLLEIAADSDKLVKLPAGKRHDALWDCYSQIKTMNGLVNLCRGEAS